MTGDARTRSIRRRSSPADAQAAYSAEVHPVLRRVYAARQVKANEIGPTLSNLLPVGQFAGALAAAERLADARERNESILIVGDFDADGATASALMVSTLRRLGFSNVDYLVPDRFRFGYGLSVAIAEQAAMRSPDLIVTVDNGVSSVAGVQRARDLGMEVMVTDHHLPGAEMPAASVIVNPNIASESFSGKSLAGVGVAFYVLAALARALAKREQVAVAEGRAAVTAGLDLVALGTVADLVPLDYNNRILVAEGLRRIRAGRCRPGLQALFAAAGRQAASASSADLAFGIAPRLNAAGRLTDMSLGIDCLLADSLTVAAPLAQRLDALNRERRDLQDRMEGEARTHLSAAQATVAQEHADAYCLFDSAWHEGVVGLVATRIKDQARRPVIAFAEAEEPGMLKGSARSIAGVHIRDVIDSVAARHPDIVTRFGGHAMAAGMTLRAEHLDRFRAAFIQEVSRFREVLEQPDVIWTDGELPPAAVTLELAEALQQGGPWGQGFPEPVFDDALQIARHRVLQDRHLKLTVRYPGSSREVDAIAFNQPSLPAGPDASPVRLVYRLDVNEFRGTRSPQLIVEHMQPG